ncbi:MAG: ATPase, partial [Proteobacteria bacterium]|nr:ATPase [Pseudomonadota bacterium]
HDELFRIEAALGPLQAMAVTGILSFTLKPDGAGTAVTMTYRVNGASGSALDKIAPAVDGMLGAQFQRLTTLMATGKATTP